MNKTREQKLVDMIFEMAVRTAMGDYKFASREEAARWAARNLRALGFNTTPVGMSFGVLIPEGQEWREIEE